MEINFQVLDCDYIVPENKPIVRLFGKDSEGKTVSAFFENYFPYFYILPNVDDYEELKREMDERYGQALMNLETVEKFLPIGYQKHPAKLIKITLRDPTQVPIVRDDLKHNKNVKEIFEADILFKNRFMIDHNIWGMKWVTVEGHGEKTSTIKTNKIIKASSVKPLSTAVNSDLKFMGIDIEVIIGGDGQPDQRKDPIAMISLSFFPKYENHNTLVLVSKPTKRNNQDILLFNSEKEMLEMFVEIIDAFDPDIITGYNSNNFDFPYIITRFEENDVSKTIGRCKQKPIISKKIGIKTRNSITGRIVVDVYELIKESVGKGLLRLKRYGLGDVSKELLDEGKLDIAHSEIKKYWNGTEEQITKLIEYARKDADLVLKLLIGKNMLDKFIEISKLSGVLLQDVLDGGESARIEHYLLREFNKQNYVVPCRPTDTEIAKRMIDRESKGLKGALVLEPEIGLHTEPIVYMDFQAMYPSIFISYNICPTTLLQQNENLENIKTPNGSEFCSPSFKQGIIPIILKNLIKERLKVKSEMKNAKTEEEKRQLDVKQYALKIMSNAFYGYTGYPRARFYVLDIASAITSSGRFLIQKTKEIVESDKKFKVLYGDTDSIMIKTPAKSSNEAFLIGKEVEEKINAELKNIVQMKIESVFKTLLILSKKRYAGLSIEKTNNGETEKIIMKGIETVRRDWCDLTSKTLFNVLQIILIEQDTKKAYDYAKDIINKLDKNEIPVEDLVITKSISKSLREYKGVQPHIELVKKMRKRSPATAPGVGDRIGFVVIKGLQLMSERAEDPEYIKQHGLKIDSKYYIESQILPPLERVFEALGITRSELIGAGKQLSILDAMRNGTKKSSEEKILNFIDGFICNKCNKTFRMVPLIGKCTTCSGEIMFYHGDEKSRFFNPL